MSSKCLYLLSVCDNHYDINIIEKHIENNYVDIEIEELY